MARFKNVKIRKKGGGFRLQRAMILKSGKLRFVKNITRARSKSVSRRKPIRARTIRRVSRKRVSRRRVRTMARRKKRRGGAKGFASSKMGTRLAQGLGAGLSGTASGLFSMVGVNLGDDIASLALGTVLDMNTKGFVKKMGQGMQIAGVAQLTAGLTTGLLSGFGVGGTTTGNASGVQIQV